MARYHAPPDPYDDFEVGCLRVYYPDSPLLFRALRAQLTQLENRFTWETGGDISAADKLEQDWLRAGLLTFDSMMDGCPDDEGCQQIIIDLTQQLEDCQNLIQEYENMEINVSCNCSGCGGGADFPPLVDISGNEINVTCLPVDPAQPFGNPDPPPFDDSASEPPEGWPDHQTFIDDRCRLANYVIDSFIEFVDESDRIENELSAGKTILEIASILLLWVPVPVGKLKGLATLGKWVARLAAVIAVAITPLEDVNDLLQLVADELRKRRQEFICALYSATSDEELIAAFTAVFNFWIGPLMANSNVAQQDKDGLQAWALEMGQEWAAMAVQYALSINIPESFTPTFDCANCAGPEGYEYIQGDIDLIFQLEGLNTTSNILVNSALVDNGVRLIVSANQPNVSARQILAAASIPDTPFPVVGFVIDVQMINTDIVQWFRGSPAAGGQLNDDLTIRERVVAEYTTLHFVRNHEGGTYPLYDSASEYTHQNASINANSCTDLPLSFAMGAKATGAGHYGYIVSNFRWIMWLGGECL